MNTHEPSLPLFSCEWCHCQLPHVCLTAPNHTSCVLATSPSALQQPYCFYLSITCQWLILSQVCGCPSEQGPDSTFTCSHQLLLDWCHTNLAVLSVCLLCSSHFSSFTLPRNSLLDLYGQCNSMIQTKKQSLSTFSFFVWKCDQYIVQETLLPQKQEYVNFCFTLSLEKTSNRGYIKQKTRTLWSHSECNEVTLH